MAAVVAHLPDGGPPWQPEACWLGLFAVLWPPPYYSPPALLA